MSCQNCVQLELGKWIKTKCCTIVEIENTDNVCLARTVAKSNHIANLPGATPKQKTEYDHLWDVRCLACEAKLTMWNQICVDVKCQLQGGSGSSVKMLVHIPSDPVVYMKLTYQNLLKPLGNYSMEGNFAPVFLGEETYTVIATAAI